MKYGASPSVEENGESDELVDASSLGNDDVVTTKSGTSKHSKGKGEFGFKLRF